MEIIGLLLLLILAIISYYVVGGIVYYILDTLSEISHKIKTKKK